MRDDSTLEALTQAKKFMFDLDHAPATIVAIPGNYAIEIIRDVITPDDVKLWVWVWHLDMQLVLTSYCKIRVWLKTRPVSRQKKRKTNIFQASLVPRVSE